MYPIQLSSSRELLFFLSSLLGSRELVWEGGEEKINVCKLIESCARSFEERNLDRA